MSRLPRKLRCPFLHQLIRKACFLCSERELWDYIVYFPSQGNSPPYYSAVHPSASISLRTDRDKPELLLTENSYFPNADFSARGLEDAKRIGKQLLLRHLWGKGVIPAAGTQEMVLFWG